MGKGKNAMARVIVRLVLGVVAALALGACQTVRTTQAGVVGVDRVQTMSPLVSSAQVDKMSLQQYSTTVADAGKQGKLNRDPQQVKRVRGIGQRLIAQTGNFFERMYGDHRALQVGDTLHLIISENANAQMSIDQTQGQDTKAETGPGIGKLAFLPMFGLLGTLIPLGPGLIALGQGDTKTLSASLLIAFDTTIAGLISGAVAFVITSIRKRWYDSYLVSMETLMEAILDKQSLAELAMTASVSNFSRGDSKGDSK